MILELPFTNDAAQIVVVQLGATKYQCEVRYNDRADIWALTMSDFATGAKLFDGVPLVLGGDLLAPYNLGLGSIVVNDENATGLDAGPDDFGVRVKAYWISP
jgi:hypothetical protein